MQNFRHYFRLILLTLPLSFPSALVGGQLPDLGNEFRSVMSISDEKLIGDLMLDEIRASGLAHQDALINEYVQHIGNKLTPYMTVPYDMRLKFFAINDASINAFAFFGGNVAVHSGLIQVSESESELAGVMAHELAHISQQHVLRQMASSKRLMPVTLAESIAAIALGVPELVLAAYAGHAQHMLNFSRQYEQEADRIGVQILAKANFDPQGLPNILERMGVSLRYHNRPPEYLLTHPLSESRIADTRSRANELQFKRQASSNMFYLVKARIAVQNATNLQLFIQEQEHILKTQRYSNKLAANYAYAYALLQKGQTDKAWEVINELAMAYPDELIVQVTTADVERQQQKLNATQLRLERLLQTYPESAAILLQYADLLIYAKQPQAAKKILARYKSLHSPEPMYYEHVRQVEGMLGNQCGILEANAEWYVLHGDFESALGQLKNATELPKLDRKTTNRIKERILAVEDLIKRVKKV